jgi:hypothetical protein
MYSVDEGSKLMPNSNVKLQYINMIVYMYIIRN